LKPSQTKALLRLYRRRYPNDGGYSKEQAWELAELSASIGCQIGLLINRQERPSMVIIGESDRIMIPELGRFSQFSGRLRGLRLLHTHIGTSGLNQEDLMDLVFLRLDAISVLNIDFQGRPHSFQWAHLMPPNPENIAYHISPLIDWDRSTVNFSQLIESLEAELNKKSKTTLPSEQREKALLISVSTESKKLQQTSLAELTDLINTAGLEKSGTLIQRVAKINPNYILGKGKLAELEVKALQTGASVLVFDCELTPSQMRNLAQITERKVLDRTQVILDIFAQHATSRAGKLQVELAQLDYTQPRLVGKNRALSRLTGGIGGRGPGETKLELDRRRIRERRTKIKKELEKIRQQRDATRRQRNKIGLPVVALVGYTNAGKSTLLNILTHSQVHTADKLFATLDPTSRRLRFPEDREVILTDTVGFIRYLPENLKEAFMATLEELHAADVLVHVIDSSHKELEKHIQAVDGILQDMGLNVLPKILAMNKWDLLLPEEREMLQYTYPESVCFSALQKKNLDKLILKIIEKLPAQEMNDPHAHEYAI
jgi:GTP-binding protein HflX